MENKDIGKMAETRIRNLIKDENIVKESSKKPYDIKTKDNEIIEIKGFAKNPFDTGFFYLTENERKQLKEAQKYSLYLVYNLENKPTNPDIIKLSREKILNLIEKQETKYYYLINKRTFKILEKFKICP